MPPRAAQPQAITSHLSPAPNYHRRASQALRRDCPPGSQPVERFSFLPPSRRSTTRAPPLIPKRRSSVILHDHAVDRQLWHARVPQFPVPERPFRPSSVVDITERASAVPADERSPQSAPATEQAASKTPRARRLASVRIRVTAPATGEASDDAPVTSVLPTITGLILTPVPPGGTRFKISNHPLGASTPFAGSPSLSTGLPADGRRMENGMWDPGAELTPLCSGGGVRFGMYTSPMTRALPLYRAVHLSITVVVRAGR
jgi:hypothetical protein